MLNWIRDAFNATIGKLPSDITTWTRDLIGGLWHYLASIFSPVSRAWDDFTKAISTLKAILTSFGIAVVNRISDIYQWINKEGYLVYYYITHPDKLLILAVSGVSTLAAGDALAIVDKLGVFTVRLVMHNLEKLIKVAEDVIDAIL